MSNLSDIGFYLKSREEFAEVIQKVLDSGEHIKATIGEYVVYKDHSGYEMWAQVNSKGQGIGLNPHFSGQSKMLVCLTEKMTKKESVLDGAFHCWANPSKENDPESGEYPFMFDVPNFQTIGSINFPKNYEVQIAAFAQELKLYESEEDYMKNRGDQLLMAPKSFIPSGLFSLDGKTNNPARALGILNGTILSFEKKINKLNGNHFYYFLVETLGGNMDVVCDEKLVNKEPKNGGLISGQFWLSGKIINPPKVEAKKNFWQKIIKN